MQYLFAAYDADGYPLARVIAKIVVRHSIGPLKMSSSTLAISLLQGEQGIAGKTKERFGMRIVIFTNDAFDTKCCTSYQNYPKDIVQDPTRPWSD